MELLMKICAYFVLEKIGRRSSLMGALFLTGLCLLINIFVSKGSIFLLSSFENDQPSVSEHSSRIYLFFPLRLLDHSYHRGILWERLLRGVVHGDVPVHDGTLSHSLEVRQQRLLIG